MLKYGWLKKTAIVLSALFIGLGLCTCGGQQPQTNVSSEQKTDVPPETPKFKKRYSNALCYKFKATPELENQYSKEIEEMQQSMVAALNQKKIFNHVDTDISNVDIGNDTLLVIVQVTYFDIVGFWKRGFAPWARSWAELELILTDGDTKELLWMEKITSANNPMGAYWSWGVTDRSLANDMGKIAAEKIAAALP